MELRQPAGNLVMYKRFIFRSMHDLVCWRHLRFCLQHHESPHLREGSLPRRAKAKASFESRNHTLCAQSGRCRRRCGRPSGTCRPAFALFFGGVSNLASPRVMRFLSRLGFWGVSKPAQARPSPWETPGFRPSPERVPVPVPRLSGAGSDGPTRLAQPGALVLAGATLRDDRCSAVFLAPAWRNGGKSRWRTT